jgi:SAM-dependent methyltransferase
MERIMTSDASGVDEARSQREAEFHDQVFVNDARGAVDRFYAVARPAFERYRALVAQRANGLDVLEYGCGPGSEAFALARRGCRVHAIDISPVAIDLAQRRAEQQGVAERCSFHVMNAEALGFSDESFDRICGSGILHHLDLERGFSEIARTLKPGGRAFFIEPLGHNPLINLYRMRTPEMRTVDEHPLLAKDLAAASRRFWRVEAEFWHLSVLAAAPLEGSPFFELAYRLLTRVDRVLLAPRSPMRWGAWLVVLTLEKQP